MSALARTAAVLVLTGASAFVGHKIDLASQHEALPGWEHQKEYLDVCRQDPALLTVEGQELKCGKTTLRLVMGADGAVTGDLDKANTDLQTKIYDADHYDAGDIFMPLLFGFGGAVVGGVAFSPGFRRGLRNFVIERHEVAF